MHSEYIDERQNEPSPTLLGNLTSVFCLLFHYLKHNLNDKLDRSFYLKF